MVQHGKTQLFFLNGICTVTFDRTIMGTAIFENPIEVRLGTGFQLGMSREQVSNWEKSYTKK